MHEFVLTFSIPFLSHRKHKCIYIINPNYLVVPCRSCVNRRFGGKYRLHYQGREIRERGISVSRWLQTVNRRFRGTYHLHIQGKKSANEEPGWACVCSHMPTLVPRSQIFLPWRWRWYLPPKGLFSQDLDGATSQKMAFYLVVFQEMFQSTFARRIVWNS
jgi:hypothetical protein